MNTINYKEELDYSKLNKEQLEAVQTDSDKVLVNSPPASGKTTVITYRVNYLINELKVDPYKIVVITFTNLAASELVKRISNCDGIFVGTIHSYAMKLLAKYNPNKIRDLNSQYANEDGTLQDDTEYFNQILIEADKLLDNTVLDIDHVLVDEYQDVGQLESSFIMKLKAKNYFYVGDFNQAIYQFKGCSDKYINKLEADDKFTKYYLSKNYRNSKNIYDYANIVLNKKKVLPKSIKVELQKDGEGKVEEYDYSDHKLGNILDKLFSSKVEMTYDKSTGKLSYKSNSVDYKNWFILCRTNAMKSKVIKELKRRNIPSTTFSIAELRDKDNLDKVIEENTVKVLTVHASKGLESDNVIYIDSHNDKVFNINDHSSNNEELNIEYVGMTRARNKLILLDTSNYKQYY